MKHLLPPVNRYFKANLHAHSTVSDGKLTPLEVKELYKSKGYSILSLTDHNIVADHSNLNDADFLMLTGAEYNINEADLPVSHLKTYHLNCIAKKPDILWQPFAAQTDRADLQDYLAQAKIENMPRVYSIDAINAIIARANETGHLVMYNHPVWSLQSYEDYAPLKGLWGMELCNYCSVFDGYYDGDNSIVYRDLMNLTGKIFPLATDDSHNVADTCGGWIMVGAETLSYDSVIDALEKGDFYASTGPEIHSLTWDAGQLRITCSDARMVLVECGNRYGRKAAPVHNDGLLREAVFDMNPWLQRCSGASNDWMRVIVQGPYGHCAATRAFTFEELK